VAKKHIPLSETIFTTRPKRKGGMVQSRTRGGQGVLRAPPRPHAPSTPERMSQLKFACLAHWSKVPTAEEFNIATDLAKGSGWYYRDVLHAAMSGVLIRDGDAPRVTTPTVKVHETVAETLTIGVSKVLTPTVRDWDTNVFWSSDVNPTRLRFRTSGMYLVGAQVQFSAVTGNKRRVALQVNAGTIIGENSITTGTATTVTIEAQTVAYFLANDYLECRAQADVAGVTALLNNFWALAITPESII